MFSHSDFVSKYALLPDEDLYNIHIQIDHYSEEAKSGLNEVIESKGGMEALKKRLQEKQLITDEIQRINNEVNELGIQGVDPAFIKTLTTSAILGASEVHEVVDRKYSEVLQVLEDKKVNSRTITGSIIGGIIASILGGVVWGMQMVITHKMIVMILGAVVVLCYGIIRVVTNQSKRNKVVFVTTIISVILALLIGQLIFEIAG